MIKFYGRFKLGALIIPDSHISPDQVIETKTIHDVSGAYAYLHVVEAYAAASLQDAF